MADASAVCSFLPDSEAAEAEEATSRFASPRDVHVAAAKALDAEAAAEAAVCECCRDRLSGACVPCSGVPTCPVKVHVRCGRAENDRRRYVCKACRRAGCIGCARCRYHGCSSCRPAKPKVRYGKTRKLESALLIPSSSLPGFPTDSVTMAGRFYYDDYDLAEDDDNWMEQAEEDARCAFEEEETVDAPPPPPPPSPSPSPSPPTLYSSLPDDVVRHILALAKYQRAVAAEAANAFRERMRTALARMNRRERRILAVDDAVVRAWKEQVACMRANGHDDLDNALLLLHELVRTSDSWRACNLRAPLGDVRRELQARHAGDRRLAKLPLLPARVGLRLAAA